MATVAEKSADLAVPEWAPSQAVDEKVDRYLAARLKAVGADYRSVAITTFLLAAAIGLVLWIGAGVVADHWVVPGGLDRTLRVAWLAVAAAAVLVAAIKWVVPLVRYRVNLVYAARSIERANPELRNDVVNTVLVRARPDRIPAMVMTSLERRTAKRLSKLPADIVADRGPALRLAVALAILVAVACLYAVFSPKSLGVSLARLVAPWSRVAPPTRVQLGAVELGWRLPAGERPGNDGFHAIPVKDGRATIIRNRQLVVRSRIQGMTAGEQPEVEAAGIAEDGSIDRVAGWRSRMEPAAAAMSGGSGGFEAVLPGGGHGLSNDVVVSVTAGDARSEAVRIVVVDAPSLLVKQLKLVPPAYTRREPEILEWQGDVSGLEGTKVTLLAESKDPLEMAAIDFGCDGQGLVKLKIDPRDLARASGSFELRLSTDRSGPWERDYQLVFRPRSGTDEDGRERGIEHRINVIADTMPEVRIVDPGKPVVKVPPEKPVAVGVEAVDPDFALRSVAIELELERDGERMPRPPQPILEREFSGPFRGQAVFKPTSVGGRAGDRLHYRAVAVDSKSPSPNAARTEWFTFDLDAGAPPRPVPPGGQQGPGGQQENDQQGNDQQGAGEGEGSKGAEGGKDGGKQDGQNGGNPAANGGKGNGKENAAGSGASGGGQEKSSGEQPKQGTGEQGSGPPEKGSEGARSQGAGGSADGSSEPSQQASAAGNEGQSQDGQQQGNGQQQGGGDQQGSGHGGGREQGQQQQQNGQQQNGQQQGGQQQGGAADKSIASDGTNDGEAIERILEERAKEGGDTKSGEKSGDKTSGEDAGAGSEKAGSEKKAGDRGGAGEPQSNKEKSDGRENGAGRENSANRENGADKKDGSDEKDGPDGKDGTDEKSGGDKSGESSECRPEEGKPCGNKECSKCRGGGSQGGGAGQGGSSSGGSNTGDSSPGGSGDGERKEGSKKPGSGESGTGQPSDNGSETAPQPGGSDGTSKGDGKKDGKQDGKSSGDRAGERTPGENGSQNAGSQKQKPGGSQQTGGGNSGDGKSGEAKPGDSEVGRPGEDLANDDPQADRKPSEESGAGGRAGRGFGGWDAGEKGERPGGQAASKEADWGEENLSHARNAVDLAVEHLKRSMDEGRSDVLDSLGWTREQAQAFLDRWARMAKDAKEGGPRKQRDFDRAVRSLGLTPPGVRRSRETVEEPRSNQAEGRRSQPPPEYREQFRAFTQGLRGDGG